ncbi:MAG: YdcF family protein [Candidatus Acinetobacter avistercoris]|uniref:ElyC/SanA/YdcF family protein n=1 Tax=Acinetobacter sp. KS-LM10 TaxID=3120518 RepID=UPI001F87A280|nr:YdcF family protein [Candidatus Acinetobacter avistercoris]
MPKRHWMISLVRMIAILFVLVGCLLVFWYTPYYSNLVVKTLNTFVSFEVDEIAAQSQKMAALTETENLEPGSHKWIARQAYLTVIEQALKAKRIDDLAIIQARYAVLKENIQYEREQKEQDKQKSKIQIPMLIEDFDHSVEHSTSELASEPSTSWANLTPDEDQALMEKYQEFLETYPLEQNQPNQLDSQIYTDIAEIQKETDSSKKLNEDKPYAIVILGGGLTLADNKTDIVVNDYTRLRLEKTLDIEKQTQLPIVLSGVEAPYMQSWLANRGVEAKLLENRSMNTCENTRFSSLLLQKKGGAPTVMLITDRYHMPRTRRLFALNGIKTIPVEAPMPTELTAWQPSKLNYDHSRRANYELLATIRDVLFGSSGCREVP